MPALAAKSSPPTHHKRVLEQYLELQRMAVAAARRSSAAFASYVMRDERGLPLRLAPVHQEWHHYLTVVPDAKERYLPLYPRFILEGAAELGKSVQLIAYCAWRIGLDPTIRIVLASKNREKAAQLLSMLTKVMLSPEYRQVFPEVVLLGANVHTLRVLGWDGKNPTVQAYQFRAPITGNRVDLIIFDDILDSENTRTEDQRLYYYNYYKNTYISRLTARGQVVFVSNSWHPRDLMHRLMKQPIWTYKRYPIWRDGPGGQKVSIWPAQWPLSRIEARKEEFGDDIRYWQRVYECVALDDSTTSWERSWIDVAEQLGRGLRMVRSLGELQGEFFKAITIGVDLATCRPARRRKTDDSAFVVTGRRADGRKRLLCVEDGKFTGPLLVNKIRDLHQRWNAPTWLETNAAQMFVADFCKAPDPTGTGMFGPIPVRSFETTAQNKYDANFGVEAIGTEMASGVHVFPTVPKEDPFYPAYQRLLGDMLSYDSGSHAGDRLMAMWIANEGLRLGHGVPQMVPGMSGTVR